MFNWDNILLSMKLRKTDSLFSKYIRNRDNWICQRCHTQHEKGSQGLHCSHFFSRGRENTRFDEENCIALCFGCHLRWGHGDERDLYRDYMVVKLGEIGFKKLMVRANQFKKRDDKADEIIIKHMLKKQNEMSAL